ncbi:hypothetical protein D9Q98_006246 [Chlorella vulgaris]|uniref:Uncharacterized protein n=1 Tax=Chlorella vulgaris TaxID=3077 RepID=A0A9D4TXI6_CHLVU|nr:hypothetical protein D9Q98_006246 [Chlorella vulgaris]
MQVGLQPALPSLLSPEQPGSAKMVSLDLLLGSNSTPATPRDPDLLPAVDPCDPLVQQLVQDKSFLTAVQTSQLHAAASAAVRLMRAQGMAGSEFKRPPDRRAAPREPYADTQETTPRGGAVLSGRAAPGSLVVQRQVVEPRHREALRGMRVEVLGLEDVIPWNLVRRTWRTKRTSWRRQIKQTEVIPDFANRLKELRAALLTEEQPLPGCGSTWRAQLEVCIQGKGSYGLLAAAWDEMRNTIRNWLDGRSKPAAQSAAQLQAGAVRAVRAMQAAWQASPVCASSGGGDAGGGDAEAGVLLQVPLESIVGYDSGAGLQAVRHAIDLEQRLLSVRVAGRTPPQQHSGAGGDALGGGGEQQPLGGYFSSISAPWCDSDFDSGAESEAMEMEEATDVDSD